MASKTLGNAYNLIITDGPNTHGRKNTLKIHQLNKLKNNSGNDDPEFE